MGKINFFKHDILKTQRKITEFVEKQIQTRLIRDRKDTRFDEVKR